MIEYSKRLAHVLSVWPRTASKKLNVPIIRYLNLAVIQAPPGVSIFISFFDGELTSIRTLNRINLLWGVFLGSYALSSPRKAPKLLSTFSWMNPKGRSCTWAQISHLSRATAFKTAPSAIFWRTMLKFSKNQGSPLRTFSASILC